MLSAELPHVVRVVGALIGCSLWVKTGECKPGCAELATRAGITLRTVTRVLATLERTKWIAVDRTDVGRRNSYVLVFPAADTPDTILSLVTTQTTPDTVLSGVPPDTPDTVLSAPPQTHCVRHKEERQRSDKGRRAPGARSPQREGPSLSDDSTSTKAGASQPAADADAVPPALAALGFTTAEQAAAFEQFITIHPRVEGRIAVAREFTRALQRTTSEKLIMGARRYAVYRANAEAKGDPKRYTMSAKRWLEEGHEDDPKLAGVVINHDDGTIVEANGPDIPDTWAAYYQRGGI
jgi:hypothetical protein